MRTSRTARSRSLVDEYGGAVENAESARDAVKAIGDADLALLAGHGVFVVASTIRAAHQRAVALETRCRNAWMVRAADGRRTTPLPEWWLERGRHSNGDGFIGFWEASVREELRVRSANSPVGMAHCGGPPRPGGVGSR